MHLYGGSGEAIEQFERASELRGLSSMVQRMTGGAMCLRTEPCPISIITSVSQGSGCLGQIFEIIGLYAARWLG